MSFVAPVTLTDDRVTLVPLTMAHAPGLAEAAADGQLWTIRVTSAPEPDTVGDYIERALFAQAHGGRVPFAVLDAGTGEVIGTTSYHDIIPEVRRVEIGYTWYAASRQRTYVNTTCKLLLLRHAFDALGCDVVGFRTDNLNTASRRAIERLGAQLDGVIRHHHLRRDGTVRDTVMYSIVRSEWPAVQVRLAGFLAR